MWSDPSLIYCGVLAEIPNEHNLSAAEWCADLGCVLRRHALGWFYYFPGNDDEKPTLYFRPSPGRQIPLDRLQRVQREFREEESPELRAMIYFAVFVESKYIFLLGCGS